MHAIKLSAKLQNCCDEIFEEKNDIFELYGLVKEGLDDIEKGNTRPFSEVISDIRSIERIASSSVYTMQEINAERNGEAGLTGLASQDYITNFVKKLRSEDNA